MFNRIRGLEAIIILALVISLGFAVANHVGNIVNNSVAKVSINK